jgi:HlyD family secretion protein
MKKRRKRTFIAAALLLAIVAIAGSSFLRPQKSELVRVAQAEKVDELRAIVTGTGEIRTRNSVDIQAEIAGVIVELPVREGDRVAKDQVLLRIDPFQSEADVQSARSQLASLEADAASQTAQIATSEANAARDAFLKKSAEVELRQAEANLSRAEAQLRREKDLLDSELLSPDQYEVTETQAKVNRAQVDAAHARIAQLDAQIAAAKALVDSAKATRESVLRRVEGARSSLARAEDFLKKTTIRSSLDGVITQLNVEVGERAVPGILSNPQATLMTIADFAVIEAELKVDETDIVSVRLDHPAKVLVDALPETPLSGKVVEIGNAPILSMSNMGGSSANQEGKDFKVVVEIEAPPPSLRPGMSCEGELTTAVKRDVLTIPIQALTAREVTVDDQGRFVAAVDHRPRPEGTAVADAPRDRLRELEGVFVFGADKTARFRPTRVGISGDMDVEVLDGLGPGDTVIVGPLKALRTLSDGDRVDLDRENPFRRSSRRRSAGSEEAEERR